MALIMPWSKPASSGDILSHVRDIPLGNIIRDEVLAAIGAGDAGLQVRDAALDFVGESVAAARVVEACNARRGARETRRRGRRPAAAARRSSGLSVPDTEHNFRVPGTLRFQVARGSSTTNVEPAPSAELTAIVPPMRSTRPRQM